MKPIRENDENESAGNINAGLGNDCQVEYRYVLYLFLCQEYSYDGYISTLK